MATRCADPDRLPGIQHEDGPLGQRTRHPHVLLHRPQGVGLAGVAREVDPALRGPALHHLPLRAGLLPPPRHRARLRGQPARRCHRGAAPDAARRRCIPPPQRARRPPDHRPGGRQPPRRDPRQPPAHGPAGRAVSRPAVRHNGRTLARTRTLRALHGRNGPALRLRPDLRNHRRGRGGRRHLGNGNTRDRPARHARGGRLPHAVVPGQTAALRAEGALGLARQSQPRARGRRRDHPVRPRRRTRRARVACHPPGRARKRGRMEADFEELRTVIGGPGASERFARCMVGELKKNRT